MENEKRYEEILNTITNNGELRVFQNMYSKIGAGFTIIIFED